MPEQKSECVFEFDTDLKQDFNHFTTLEILMKKMKHLHCLSVFTSFSSSSSSLPGVQAEAIRSHHCRVALAFFQPEQMNLTVS